MQLLGYELWSWLIACLGSRSFGSGRRDAARSAKSKTDSINSFGSDLPVLLIKNKEQFLGLVVDTTFCFSRNTNKVSPRARGAESQSCGWW
eukprot:g11556.t1